MTATTARPSPAERHDERRVQLAESALQTLGELGYGRASLREIAANSPFSHGVVHYYFADKLELIVYCVQHYKATCVTRYDDAVASAGTAADLVEAFVAKLVETVVDDAAMHRLWYDLRAQSMYEPRLAEAVEAIDRGLEDMIWRVVVRHAELAGGTPGLSPAVAYGLLDGLFQQALLAHLRGRAGALDELDGQVREILPRTVAAG